jgi:2-iminobutanoate/2-iminopropanoate deaminase
MTTNPAGGGAATSHLETRPQTVGPHYSPAVKHGGLVYISGQLPVGPNGVHDSEISFASQVRQVLENLLGVLQANGADGFDNLLKVTAYIVGGAYWAEFNQVYAEVLGDARPARTVVPVTELHYGYLVEVDAIARTSSD